jgi:copper chaperone
MPRPLVRYGGMTQRNVEIIETIVLKVQGMSCDACVRHVTRALEGMRGVSQVDVSLKQASATVEYEPAKVDVQALQAAIRDAGYAAAPGRASCCCSTKSDTTVGGLNA